MMFRLGGFWEFGGVVIEEHATFTHLALHDVMHTFSDPVLILQGDFFNWPSPISVPKRKLLGSQSRPFLVTGFSVTAAVVG